MMVYFENWDCVKEMNEENFNKYADDGFDYYGEYLIIGSRWDKEKNMMVLYWYECGY